MIQGKEGVCIVDDLNREELAEPDPRVLAWFHEVLNFKPKGRFIVAGPIRCATPGDAIAKLLEQSR